MKKTVLLINDDLIIKLSNGKLINYSPADKDLYNEVLALSDDSEIETLIKSKVMENRSYKTPEIDEEKIEYREKINQYKNVLSNLKGEFKFIGADLYLEGAPFPVADLLIEKFYLCVDESGFALNPDMIEAFEALKNFWYLSCLNPNDKARDGMFEFLQRTGFKIMSNGMAMGYRRVVSNGIDSSLTAFISNQYLKVRTIKKEDPNHFVVVRRSWIEDEEFEVEVDCEENDNPTGETIVRRGYYDKEGDWIELSEDVEYDEEEPIYERKSREITKSEYKLISADIDDLDPDCETVGNLLDLYLRLPDLQYETFTDQRTGTFKIKIAEEVSMPREECDSNGSRDCSAGLHLAANLADYASFGDVSLLCAFSPRNVVSVPESYTSKMRVCAYMPLAILEPGEEKFLDDADTLKLADEYCIEDLEKVKTELKAKDLPENMTMVEATELLTKIDQIKEKLKSRVIHI